MPASQVPMANKVELVNVARLIPYPKNTRTHSAGQIEKVAQSIRQFGFTVPILISKDSQVIAGHGRLLAAKKLGLTQVPCIRAEHLSEAQWRAYSIADNRLTELGDWNEELLGEELKALKLDDIDLSLTGFTDVEILQLLDDGDSSHADRSLASLGDGTSVGEQHDAVRTVAATSTPQQVSAAALGLASEGTVEVKGKGFMVVGYCENYSQQLDALNALRALGIKCVAK